jgi:tetratricopeptide (TPR) repeat protein
MNIIRRAKGDTVQEQSQRIFLCLDSQNTGEADRLITERLLPVVQSADYVVSYLEAPSSALDEDLLRNELSDTSVMALWVTEELLESRKTRGSWPTEYDMARELSLAIIPIVEDAALFSEFSRLSDAVHGIGMDDDEYLLRYASQLSSYLHTEEELKLIREKAFTAEIFLSYRKKNIHEAREFMRKLHSIKGFETISVWYDNFLTAGRNFNDEIKDSIRNSDAFVLLVTPDLATEGNYVQTTEYPFACESGKTIIAVEATPTDPTRFECLYPGTKRAVPVDDAESLRDVFARTLKIRATDEPMSGERAYLLGLAYLSGQGVERDTDRALSLLETAAEGDDLAALHACFPLCHRYGEGFTAYADHRKAYYYRKKSIDLSEQLLGPEHLKTAEAYYEMASLCADRGDFEPAFEYVEKALGICERELGTRHSDTAATYSLVGDILMRSGEYAQAMSWLEKALEVYEEVLGSDSSKTATAYGSLATAYSYVGDFAKALEYTRKTLESYEALYGKDDSRTAMVYQNIGGIYNGLGDYSAALEWLNRALASQQKAFMSEDHRDIAITHNTMSVVYYNLKQYKKALEEARAALSINVKTLGMSHPDTINTRQSMENLLAVMRSKKRLKITGAVLLAVCLIGIALFVLLR